MELSLGGLMKPGGHMTWMHAGLCAWLLMATGGALNAASVPAICLSRVGVACGFLGELRPGALHAAACLLLHLVLKISWACAGIFVGL